MPRLLAPLTVGSKPAALLAPAPALAGGGAVPLPGSQPFPSTALRDAAEPPGGQRAELRCGTAWGTLASESNPLDFMETPPARSQRFQCSIFSSQPGFPTFSFLPRAGLRFGCSARTPGALRVAPVPAEDTCRWGWRLLESQSWPTAPPHRRAVGWEGLVRRPPLLPAGLALPRHPHPLWAWLTAGQALSAAAQHSLFLSNLFYC